jgi:hypothetical protein
MERLALWMYFFRSDSIDPSKRNSTNAICITHQQYGYSCVPCTNNIIGALPSVRDSRWIGEQHRKDAQIEAVRSHGFAGTKRAADPESAVPRTSPVRAALVML